MAVWGEAYMYREGFLRTAIEAVSFLALEYNKCGFWSESVKAPPEQSSSGKKIQAESAVAARQSAVRDRRKNSY